MEQDRIGKATFAYQLCWRTVCTSDYSLADASSYSVLTMYLGGYRKSISKQLIDGILAAEPQHRVLARRHHHAGIGTMHNCVVQIGIGETTHRRSDISARSSCWRPAHAPLITLWPIHSAQELIGRWKTTARFPGVMSGRRQKLARQQTTETKV